MLLQDSLTPVHHPSPIVVSIGKAIAAAASFRPLVFFFLPVAVALGGLFLRARAKRRFSISAHELLFGFDLGATACVLLPIAGFGLINKQPATDVAATQQATYYATGLFVLLLMFLSGLITGAILMNKWGWEESEESKVKKGWWIAINAAGIIFLWIAYLAVGEAT